MTTSPEDFVRTSATALFRTAMGLCGDRASAEDLVAAAIARCIPAWSAINGPPLPYVRRAMVNLHLNDLRRRERPVASVPETAGLPDPADRVADRIDLSRALATLTDLERTVVILRYVDGLSAVEVGAVVDKPAGTVRRLAHQALKKLRSRNELDASAPTGAVKGAPHG